MEKTLIYLEHVDACGADGPIENNIKTFDEVVEIMYKQDKVRRAYSWDHKKNYPKLTFKDPHKARGVFKLDDERILFMWTDKIVKVFEEDDPLAEETEEQRRGKSVAEGEEE